MKKYLLGIGITLLATQAYAYDEESITYPQPGPSFTVQCQTVELRAIRQPSH
jgi:hypothetical protein